MLFRRLMSLDHELYTAPAQVAAPPWPLPVPRGLTLTLVGDVHGEDGFLTLKDIFDDLPINAYLVVLSACNTAGDPQRGNLANTS